MSLSGNRMGRSLSCVGETETMSTTTKAVTASLRPCEGVGGESVCKSSLLKLDGNRSLPLDIPTEDTTSDDSSTSGADKAWEADSLVEESEMFLSTSVPIQVPPVSPSRRQNDQMSLLSSSLSSKMELEIMSRSVWRWRRSTSANEKLLQPWDFSEVSSAVDNTAEKLSEGKVSVFRRSHSSASSWFFVPVLWTAEAELDFVLWGFVDGDRSERICRAGKAFLEPTSSVVWMRTLVF